MGFISPVGAHRAISAQQGPVRSPPSRKEILTRFMRLCVKDHHTPIMINIYLFIAGPRANLTEQGFCRMRAPEAVTVGPRGHRGRGPAGVGRGRDARRPTATPGPGGRVGALRGEATRLGRRGPGPGLADRARRDGAHGAVESRRDGAWGAGGGLKARRRMCQRDDRSNRTKVPKVSQDFSIINYISKLCDYNPWVLARFHQNFRETIFPATHCKI
jgi:hypothetical protein